MGNENFITKELEPYDRGKERRCIRCLALRLRINNPKKVFKTDKEFLSKLSDQIINSLAYCFYNVSDEKFDDYSDELHNIAFVIHKLYELDYGERTHKYFIKIYEYILNEMVSNENYEIIELIKSNGLLFELSFLISQSADYKTNTSIATQLHDLINKNKSRFEQIYFMTYLTCPNKKEMNVDICKADAKIIYYMLKSTAYSIDDNKIVTRIQELINAGDSEIVKALISLCNNENIDISIFDKNIKDNMEYRLIYYPDQIDYDSIPVEIFFKIKKINVVDNLIEYGGISTYKRIFDYYKKYSDVIYNGFFRLYMSKAEFVNVDYIPFKRYSGKYERNKGIYRSSHQKR